MSLNTSTDGKPIQILYVYRYDYIHFEFGRGFDLPHYKGYEASLNKPYIPTTPGLTNNKSYMIEVIKLDTRLMTARPIDSYFKKIKFVWNDEKFKRKFNQWREFIKQFETTISDEEVEQINKAYIQECEEFKQKYSM